MLALAWYGRDGASSRVRMMQYAPHLAELGIDLAVHSLLPEDYVGHLYQTGRRPVGAVAAACLRRIGAMLSHRRVDMVWVQREAVPFLPFMFERGLYLGRPIVVDYDDAHHLFYKRFGNPIVRLGLENKLERLMAMADAVTVGSPGMAGVAKQSGATRVHVVPSAVDVTQYTASAGFSESFTAGWIGSPMTADESLPLVTTPLRRLLAETGAKCRLIGVRADQFPDVDAERVPWSEAGEQDGIAGMTVGLCPLPDTDWHRGKSGYKIIQYMAAGKPTLASPVGIAADLVRDGETGFLCRTADDWYARLVQLQRNPKMCETFGARAAEIARQRFDIKVVAAQLSKIFMDVVRGQP